MQKHYESPILFTIYESEILNSDIHRMKIVCNSGLEINLSNRSGSNRLCHNNVLCLTCRELMNALYCKCGSLMDTSISILQCPECLKLSLPSIVSPSLEGKETNDVWNKLKKVFDDSN